MPQGDKKKYTDKQKRQAQHIEEGYEKKGLMEDEAERRAWATVNKMSGGGKKAGAGRKKKKTKTGTPKSSQNSPSNTTGRKKKTKFMSQKKAS